MAKQAQSIAAVVVSCPSNINVSTSSWMPSKLIESGFFNLASNSVSRNATRFELVPLKPENPSFLSAIIY